MRISIISLITVPLLCGSAAAQALRDVKVQGHIGEPTTNITITPHRVKSFLTHEIRLENYPINGGTPELIFKTRQNLKGVKAGKTTVEEFIGGLPIAFRPEIERFDINEQPEPRAKFSITSWIDYGPTLAALLDSGAPDRLVYPGYSIAYPAQPGKRGSVNTRFVFHESGDVFRRIRSKLLFPFEKNLMQIGLAGVDGLFNFTVMPIEGLTTEVHTVIMDRLYPFKVNAVSPEVPTGRNDLTLTGRVQGSQFWFFDISFERPPYEKFIVLFTYALPFLCLFTAGGKVRWTVITAVSNVLLSVLVFEKRFFCYADGALLISILIALALDLKKAGGDKGSNGKKAKRRNK